MMKELNVQEVQNVNGGAVVFLIPPAVGGALKVAGFVGAFVGGVGGGAFLANRFFSTIDALRARF
ncbi:hypothetical protein [Pseudoalteromonas phenolica]|jgi:hypothetical protein|uniref:hypothetical protein n=1 Tax=Pseudoalteromonas phenolica TaxID=161398 RepID=UPI00110A45B1|nr:hypothetical protein [Pseudoalteromonas phenolica]TMO54349.1 hypothetical protein CWC21_15535 [Pseudoalteromonas phenolica]